MIIKLKKRPGPKGAVEPVIKKILFFPMRAIYPHEAEEECM
jgi:hypothetical protein